MGKKCKICGSETYLLFQEKVLGKYLSDYLSCKHCGFIQIDDTPWLEEAYASAITSLDIGLVNRNLIFIPIVNNLIRLIIGNDKQYIDYGGGYGLFVRLLRDKGFDYYLHDKYCENIFASGFNIENAPTNTKFSLLTAFEVFEHITDPAAEVKSMMSFADNILFSTEIQPAHITNIASWNYFLPEIGQHVSFYTIKSLSILAEKNSFYYYTNGRNMHFFSKNNINKTMARLILSQTFSKVLYQTVLKNKKSLLEKDFQVAFKSLKNLQSK